MILNLISEPVNPKAMIREAMIRKTIPVIPVILPAHGGKDLKGFLDYIDSDVLEKGRTINRDFFYDMHAVMMVDKDLSSDEDSIEKNLIMSLAMANNFHDTDVTINDCYLNAANAAEYRYHVTAYGKDDTGVVNYRDRTMYMNDGKTEYVSVKLLLF